MKRALAPLLLALLSLSLSPGCKEKKEVLAPAGGSEPAASTDLEARAKALAQRFLIVDGHVDLPYRLHASRDAEGRLTEDVSGRTQGGDFD